MENVLCLLHTESDGALGKAAREALAAAKQLPGTLVVGLLGAETAAAADSIAGCGAAKILAVSGAEFGVSRYGTDAAAAEALVKASGATVVVAPGTLRFSRALPGVAARLAGRIDTKVTGLVTEGGTIKVQRWFYRQRMMGTLSRSQRPWFIVIAPGSFAEWQGAAGTAAVEAVPVETPASLLRTRVKGTEAASAGAQTIRPDAKLMFVAGAGWTKKQADGQAHLKDAETLILGFITGAQASLGSSKSLVDLSGEGEAVLSFLTHLNQVGQTGATPRHPKGLATCCHGEEPHVVGWRFITERRAVNTDPNCGWAQGKTDVLYVADAFAVMKKVNELLGEK